MGNVGEGSKAIMLAHSSDLHVGDPLVPGAPCGLSGLASVLGTAASLGADAVLLAGDTFDNLRVSTGVLAQARDLLAAATRPVILLPGNHDPAVEACLFDRAGILALPHVHVLGIREEALLLGGNSVEVRGLAHRSFSDFAPLPNAWPRRSRWQVVMAHGHYVAPGEEAMHAHRAWRFNDAALAALGADYVALGHWDRPACVGTAAAPAYYSGSPDLAGTLNLVRFQPDGGVTVSRETLSHVG